MDQFCPTPFGERKIWRLSLVSDVRCWWMSLNLISKYLFLEQKAQSLEEVLTFLTKAGGSIHIFSESTHIEALIKPCKMMKIKKKSYLYNPNGEFRFMTGENINSAIISDMCRNGWCGMWAQAHMHIQTQLMSHKHITSNLGA